MDLFALAAQGMPGRGAAPPGSFLRLVGSPHVLISIMAALLIALALVGRRDKNRWREKWLIWAFGASILREAATMLTKMGPPRMPGGPPPGPFGPIGPLFGLWSEHMISALLFAAFLRYLTDREQQPRRYLIVSTALLTAAAAFVPMMGPQRGFFWPSLTSLAGLVTMGYAFVLTRRGVPASTRTLMFAVVGTFAVRDLMQLVFITMASRPGPPPGQQFVGVIAFAGLLLCGFLFVRERSILAATDIEALEGIVGERTRDLQSAMEKLSEANALLREQSTIDALTGVRNRRSFDDALFEEWNRARRSAASVAVALVDIDQFKAINDQYGHPAGDECLMCAAAVLTEGARRPEDVVARYGGDEFALLLPGADHQSAVRLLEKIRRRITALRGISDAPGLAFTVSVGVAVAAPREGGSPEDLIRRADEELYRAKQNGRNQVAGTFSALETAG